MNNTLFPKELREHFQIYHSGKEGKDSKKLNTLFYHSPAVREAFISWAESHSVVVQHTPRLYQALNIAKSSFSANWEETACVVNDLYGGRTHDPSMSLVNEILVGGVNAKPFYIIPEDYIERVVELFESGVLRLEECVSLIQVRDRFGLIPPLHYEAKFPLIIPLLKEMDSESLKKIFSIQENIAGSTLLHYFGTAKFLPPILEKMDLSHLKELLLIKDKEGSTPLHHDNTFSCFIPVLEKMETTQLVELFFSLNKKGKNPLNVDVQYLEATILPFLAKRNDESLNLLFSAQDAQGNTLLHDPLIFENLKSLLNRLKPQVFEIRNHLGSAPGELPVISLGWLVKDKEKGLIKPLSEEDYREKTLQLKQTIDEFWNSFTFEEDVPDEYLVIRVNEKNQRFSPNQIKEKMDVIVDKIINKTPWLGTPRQEEKKELHQFYSQMLFNFEKLIEALKSKDLITRVGCFISLARPVLEGRCAAAYQSEIEQAKMLHEADQATGMLFLIKRPSIV